MTTLTYLHQIVIPAAFALLPEMASLEAEAMLLAIALQESKAAHRMQVNGPARGFWQFEIAGVKGVLGHQATRDFLLEALDTLSYRRTTTPLMLQHAVEDNDVLACVFARLNLWWLPEPLPGRENPDEGWRQYLAAWRPGKPHPDTWDAYYARAWEMVDAD